MKPKTNLVTKNISSKSAAETERRKRFLRKANTSYARLRKDPKAWDEELAERALWDATLSDGLEEDI